MLAECAGGVGGGGGDGVEHVDPGAEVPGDGALDHAQDVGIGAGIVEAYERDRVDLEGSDGSNSAGEGCPRASAGVVFGDAGIGGDPVGVIGLRAGAGEQVEAAVERGGHVSWLLRGAWTSAIRMVAWGTRIGDRHVGALDQVAEGACLRLVATAEAGVQLVGAVPGDLGRPAA